MIKKAILIVLSLFAAVSAMLIPISYLRQPSAFEIFTLLNYDHALQGFVLAKGPENFMTGEELGRRIVIGSRTSVRALLSAVKGRAEIAIAVPKSTTSSS